MNPEPNDELGELLRSVEDVMARAEEKVVASYGPQRPDTPTFWRLSDLLRALDARQILSNEVEMYRVLSEVGVDARSVDYVAAQRAMRALPYLDVTDRELLTRVITVISLSWMEGFIAGRGFDGPVEDR